MSQRTDLERARDQFLDDKAKPDRSGNYRRNAGRVLDDWITWLANGQPTYQQRQLPEGYRDSDDDEPVERVGDLSVEHFAGYARLLRARAYDSEEQFSTASASTYYAYLRAFCSWCVKRERMSENPAAKDRATELLPNADQEETDRQVWTPEQRASLLEYVDERARAAIDEDPHSRAALRAGRDRALVALLAFSGLRAAEFLRAPHDARRDGATWSDLRWPAGTAPGDAATASLRETDHEDAGQLSVLGKSQEREPARIARQAFPPLRRYYQLLEPATENWPLFPTLHPPSLYEVVRGTDVDMNDDDPLAACRDADLVPPASTTEMARHRLRTICENADIELSDDVSYLQPHGGRRGLGDQLYQQDPVLAQDVLRHQNIETTNEAYRERRAEEDAARVSEVLDNSDDEV